MKLVFNPNTNGSNNWKELLKKDNQPPVNNKTVKRLINIIEPYSAKKKRANPILAYSTLKPETNSDSASGKSKGALLVSAKILIKNIIKRGKNGKKKYIYFWKTTTSIRFNEPTHAKIPIKIKPIDTS